jgi:hypothetical protein
VFDGLYAFVIGALFAALIPIEITSLVWVGSIIASIHSLDAA